jgi:2-polyprenyl-3-methyl-5-hydroxy-6-metoxy-1,4-benzoquinol methylase/predicted RNA-binding Zn-ribbon protein involved in translation (DUF1610 family)
MNKVKEINRGYLDYLKDVSPRSVTSETAIQERPPSAIWRLIAAVSGGMADGWKQRLRPTWVAVLGVMSSVRGRIGRLVASVTTLVRQIVITTLLLLTSILLGVWLKVYLWLKGSQTAPLNGRALERVAEFVEQYPLHLYPIVAKSFEFAFLEREVNSLLEKGARFLEIAIGEGTFSAKIFPPDAEVVGLDLSPYSLSKAANLRHVREAVICDCLCPPIRGGHFDVIIANNFLHHVTMKTPTLANWSKVAPKLIFNESTPYWASGWVVPFMLKKLGLKSAALHKVDEVNHQALQYLEPKDVLDNLVRNEYEVIEESSYMSERTFFLCAVYSFIMRCYGPPTPAYLKGLFLSRRLRWLTVGLTTAIAKMLIRYDQFQNRSTDAYVSYVCESRHPSVAQTEQYLICPRCGGELTETDRCKECRKQYSRKDHMLFLLPEECEYIETGYDPEVAQRTLTEHL